MSEDRLDRIEALLEQLTVNFRKRLDDFLDLQEVFDKRIKALIARDEALQARHEALTESVEMLVQTLFRRGGGE